MSPLINLKAGFRGLFRRKQVESELNAELQAYLEHAVEQKMLSGMDHEQALRLAGAEMGSAAAVRDQVHEAGWESLLASLWADLRYGLRTFLKNPGFTALAVVTLALGMGASASVFGWIDGMLLHPLPGVARPGELVSFENVTPNGQPITTSYPDFRDYRDHLKLLAGIAMARHTSVSVGEDENTERVPAQFVSGNYFDVLGVTPALGRVFLPEEYGDAPRAFPVAVISDHLWRSHFNSDPQITGKTIRINQHELTIIGVTRPDFRGSMAGLSFDVWVPNVMRPLLSGFKTDWQMNDRQNRDLLGIARLKPGVTVEQAQAEIATLAQELGRLYPDTNQGVSATVLPIWKAHFGVQALLLAPLQILSAVCVVVLLIVCANVANLLLTRFTTRQKEFSVRLALGARRSRLVRQLLTESLMLAAAGSLFAAVMAVWSGGLLRALLPPGQGVQVAMDIRMNGTMLAFIGLLCVGATLLCGLMPAFQSVHVNLNDSLKESGRSSSAGRQSHRMRALLVVSEVSLALVALIGAGLFVRGFRAAQKINTGFDPNNVLLSQFYLATSGYDLHQREQFCFRLREKLESQPGVIAVTYSDASPLGFEPSWWEPLEVKGYQPRPGENMRIYRNVVAPGYFSLMRIPILEGRDFTEKDDDKDKTTPVMVVNESFVKRFFPQGQVIGRQVHGWGSWFTVVGIAKDSKYNYLTESSMPYFYVPFRQTYRADMNLAFYIRTKGDPNLAFASLRSAVRDTDPKVTIFDALPLSEYIGASLFPKKMAASLLGMMGLLSLLLAAVGLYSVMAYAVVQRTHEIGVRMALGAQRANVLGLVLRQAMNLTVGGLFLGGAMALVLSRKVSTIDVSGSTMGGAGSLLGTGAVDPLIYAGAALFLCVIAALASYIPARRATRVDPLVALRCE
jgi:predicted permease